MTKNSTSGPLSHETKMRVLTAVRSLAIQGSRIETHIRKTRWAGANSKTGVTKQDCGCKGTSGNQSAANTSTKPASPDDRAAFTDQDCKRAELQQSARLTARAMRKAHTNARAILKVAEQAEFMQDPKAWREAMKAFVSSPKSIADTRKFLSQYGFNIDVAQHVIDELAKLETPPQLARDLKALKIFQQTRDGKIGKSTSALTGDDISEVTDGIPIDVSFTDGGVEVSVRCDRLPPPLDIGCDVLVVGVFIAVGIVLIVNWVEDIFNATDDDQARAKINSSTCPEIAAIPIDVRLTMMRAMISGPTGDDDENAIARLLECSPCEDVLTLIAGVGGVDSLLDEFQGSEWDRLMLRLQQCGLVDFADWDDDATRLFINRSDCATLNALTLTDIRRLILNMFSGSTGDDDEDAIVRLIGCLPCGRRHTLMTLGGMSEDDFDDSVDGSQWTSLRRLLRCT